MVKAETTKDAVRYSLLAQLFLKGPALSVGAVEDGEIVIVALLLFHNAPDVLGHDHHLFLVAIERLVSDGVAHLVLAIDVFLYLPLIVLDKTVGSIDDLLRGSVVALKFEEAGVFVEFLEAEDVFDVCTTEGIDALRVVAHDAHPLSLLGEQVNDLLLCEVGVLVLIHQHIFELVHVVPSHFLMVVEEEEGVEQQVVEIHGIGLTAPLCVFEIYLVEERVVF